MGVEPPRILVARILMKRRWVRAGPCDSPARSSGSAHKPTTQIRRPRGAVIGHMLASAWATIAVVGGHALRVFDRSGISSRMGGRFAVSP